MSVPLSSKPLIKSPDIWMPFGEGTYSVSSLGRIRNNRTGKILRTFYSRDGYRKIKLYDRSGKRIANRVHVLVAKCHIRPPLPGEEVDHLDGRRDNNVVSNLRWVTHKENICAGMIRREREAGQIFLFEG